MFKKILVAIDYSTTSKKVFEAALSLAQTTGASLMLLHVLPFEPKIYPSPFIYYGLEAESIDESTLIFYQQHWQRLEQEGLELLQSLTEEATQAGVKTEFKQTLGYPGRNICEEAQTWSAELILVGSRGLTGVQEMFLGSVSNYVTHHAPCSVLIVRQDAEEVRSQESSFKDWTENPTQKVSRY